MGFEAKAPLVRLLAEPVPVPRSRPRLYAIDSESDETVALQSEVERRLVGARFYEPEKRPFWPHLTVARVRPSGGPVTIAGAGAGARRCGSSALPGRSRSRS